VFPAHAMCGHITRQSCVWHHNGAIKRSGVKRFQVYTLRHSALTRLAESGCDAFTLARIAGHSSITITQRYCHPQAEAIDRAFAKLSQRGVTNGGYQLLEEAVETA
jgi:site-specific recombinase XerD